MRMRAARIPVLLVTALVASSCIFGQPDTTKPTPTPTPTATAEPSPTRPRLELSTYQYGLQVKGKIRVGVLDKDQPFSVRSGSVYDGFDADIAREIARAIWGPSDDPDTHIEWISVDASTRVAALTSDQADIVLGGLAINDDNKKVIDLSDPYEKNGQRLLVKKANNDIKELADLAAGDQTVCAIKGSVWEANLKKVTNERAKILELDTLEFCMQALKTGAADAFTHDEVVLLNIVYRDPDVKLVAKPFTDGQLGIGMKKNTSNDRTGFREFVNTALLTIVANRTWAKIYERWLTPLTGEKKQLPTD
jgi:ABC-type amino acid transport substrate-binding protein